MNVPNCSMNGLTSNIKKRTKIMPKFGEGCGVIVAMNFLK